MPPLADFFNTAAIDQVTPLTIPTARLPWPRLTDCSCVIDQLNADCATNHDSTAFVCFATKDVAKGEQLLVYVHQKQPLP